MKRRELIAMLGSAAVAWPLASRAQPASSRPVLGFLNGLSPADPQPVSAFKQGLNEIGFAEGQNVTIEYRWAEHHLDRLPALAADLANRKVDVIVAMGGDVSVRAAMATTKTIPIVFLLGSDPVKFGAVNSLSRPNGNATGITILSASLEAKRLELLHEVVPKADTVAVLVNPGSARADSDVQEIERTARTLGLRIQVVTAGAERDFDAAFAAVAQNRAGALQVIADPFFNARRERLAALAAGVGVPTIYSWREFPVVGGLMSYGTSIGDAYRQLGIYAGRILKGTKPADLPVEQVTKVEFVINLKTAKALGLTIPLPLLGRADEVIE